MGYRFVYSDELSHSGRKGMKWYQHIFTKAKSSSNKNSKETSTDDKKTTSKRAQDMTNAELRREIERKKLENEYRQYYPEHVSLGKRFAKSLAYDVALPAARESGKLALRKVLDTNTQKFLESKGLIEPKDDKKK